MKRLFLTLIILAALVSVVSADTLIVYTSGSEDGQIHRDVGGSYEDWSTIVAGAGNTVYTFNPSITIGYQSGNTRNTYRIVFRGYFEFNTSELPDSATVSNAVVSLYGYSKTDPDSESPSIALVSFSPATNGTAVASDYSNFGSTELSNEITYSGFSTTGYNNFTLTSTGRTYISKTGYSNFGVRFVDDITSTQPTWGNKLVLTNMKPDSAEQTGTSNDPFLTITYSAPPVSAFSANVTSGTEPLSVAFTDASTNTPTNWDWYWYANETKSSDDQNPTTTLAAGTYNVRLYTSNAEGNDWENKTAYINVSSAGGSPPVASFTANMNVFHMTNPIIVTDTSTNTPTSWNWSWGDGTANDTTQNPTHRYNRLGRYNVQLTATNAAGSGTSAVFPVRVIGFQNYYWN